MEELVRLGFLYQITPTSPLPGEEALTTVLPGKSGTASQTIPYGLLPTLTPCSVSVACTLSKTRHIKTFDKIEIQLNTLTHNVSYSYEHV